MKRLVISPSKLEKWRFHLKYPDTITFEDFKNYLEGKQKFSAKAINGTLFHLMIQHGPDCYYNKDSKLYQVPDPDSGQFTSWQIDEIQSIFDFRKSYPHLVHEQKCSYQIQVGNYDIYVPMRIDAIGGIVCHDHKYVVRDFANVEGYMDSFQWKIYLLATECKIFQYNIFVEEPRDSEDEPRKIELLDFQLYPYQHMYDDVHTGFAQFINFCDQNDLLHLLEPRY